MALSRAILDRSAIEQELLALPGWTIAGDGKAIVRCYVFDDFAAPKGAEDRQLWLEDSQPMLFAGGKSGITLNHEGMSDAEVTAAIARYELEVGLPTTDALTRSSDRLVDMVLASFPELMPTPRLVTARS